MTADRIEAIDLNPMHWVGHAASAALKDVWQAAMNGLWSAALWVLKLVFRVIDSFTTPDLSGHGPLSAVLPTTLWLGLSVAVVMMFVQLAAALLRRDGRGLGRVLVGVAQFGLVWAAYLGVGAGLVIAAAGLQRGILQAMLHVDSLSQVDLAKSWPSQLGDATLATVLGALSLLVVIPAAFIYLVIMFVREAALLILIATAPISAGGLLSDIGRVWFWKTLRWFVASLLIAPCAALLLGIGVRLASGVMATPTPPRCRHRCTIGQLRAYASALDTSHTGMAVVGCIVIAIGAVCPLVLFRLLSFLEPGTASGAALHQSWADVGGLGGVLSRGSTGSEAATATRGDGRSGGEASSESMHGSRLAAVVGTAGAGIMLATDLAHTAANLGADVLGQGGIGHPGGSVTPSRTPRHPAGNAASPPPNGDEPVDVPKPQGSQPPDPPTPPTPAAPPPATVSAGPAAADGHASEAAAADGHAAATGAGVAP